MAGAAPLPNPETPRHVAFVRITHWVTVIAFLCLLVSGIEILVSHPRFYWGESGNALTPVLFKLPIPASRATVPTGYGYVLPDQNGWSRYLHFQSAWAVVLAGLIYAVAGFWTGHFRNRLLPVSKDHKAEANSYNVAQQVTYLAVIFVLFPLVIWTGLAMSPAFDAAVPAAVTTLGGRQSARTLHFFVAISLVLFLVVHIAMIIRSGFRSHMRAMITGRTGVRI